MRNLSMSPILRRVTMRYIISCVAGIAVSLLIFLMMTFMLDKYESLPNPPQKDFPEFATYESPEPLLNESPELEPPPIVNVPPTLPRQEFIVEQLDPVQMPTVPKSVQIDGTAILLGVPQPPDLGEVPAQNLTVLVGSRVKYPSIALRRNLEGYVLVENTVDKYGRVINVRVIESSHRLFESAARNSVLKWKYSKSALNKRFDRKRIAFQLEK